MCIHAATVASLAQGACVCQAVSATRKLHNQAPRGAGWLVQREESKVTFAPFDSDLLGGLPPAPNGLSLHELSDGDGMDGLGGRQRPSPVGCVAVRPWRPGAAVIGC